MFLKIQFVAENHYKIKYLFVNKKQLSFVSGHTTAVSRLFCGNSHVARKITIIIMGNNSKNQQTYIKSHDTFKIHKIML